jgi:hypothetical protein
MDEPLRAALEALRTCCRESSPWVVEHDWGDSLAYGAPLIFAYVWPQATHLTLGLLEGARLRSPGGRLLGHGPSLRTVVVRRAEEVDEELEILVRHAAARAAWQGRR